MENLHDVVSYAVNDFIAWEQRKELNLSPSYQRNAVWDTKAKSYLIDTILRGLVIPPVFLKQTFDIDKKITYKEVVDGQQRIRTILEFQNNEFQISSMHNDTYPNMYYDDLPDEAKTAFLSYRFPVEIIKTQDEGIIYDIFARLNSSGLPLTKQELRNAKYRGYFKNLAYKLAKMCKDAFVMQKIFTNEELSRMDDVEFISKLLIVCIEKNIVNISKNIIDKYYEKYENNFENVEEIEENFKSIINIVLEVEIDIKDYKLKNKPLWQSKMGFYDMFLIVCVIIFQMGESNKKFLLPNTELKKNNYLVYLLAKFNLDYDNFRYQKGFYENSDLKKIFEEYKSASLAFTYNLQNVIKRINAIIQYLNNSITA